MALACEHLRHSLVRIHADRQRAEERQQRRARTGEAPKAQREMDADESKQAWRSEEARDASGVDSGADSGT